MTRRLRITASVFFATLMVLLCILWVRSYWRNDRVLIPTPFGNPLGVESFLGRTMLSMHRPPILPNEFTWLVVVIEDQFGNGEPSERPRLTWYSVKHDFDVQVKTLSGVQLPYRYICVVCGILSIVIATDFPDRFVVRSQAVTRAVVASVLVLVVTLIACL